MLTVVITHLLFYAVLLFAGAGTLAWPAAWLFLALYAGQMIVNDLRMAQLDPELARERRLPGTATAPPNWDRRFLVAGALIGPAWMLLMALDAGRFGWSRLPLGAALPGAALMLLGTFIAYAGLRANR